ncbi:methyltransferase [Chloroflexota bacterium]
MKKSLVLALLLMGFTGILAQVVLIRELLVSFHGNELSIGIILANWLILEAAGSFFLGRAGNKAGRGVKTYIILQIAMAVFLPLAVYGARIVKSMLGIPPGEMVGLFPIFYSSLMLLAPVSLAGGAHFTIGCRVYSELTEEAAPSVARVYIYEAIGALIGGLLLTLAVIPYFHSVEVALGVSILNLISATLLIVLFQKPFMAKSKRKRRPALNSYGRGIILFLASIILLVVAGCFLFTSRADEVHQLSVQAQWPGYDLEYYQNSSYGNIAVTSRGDEYTFYSDGIPITTAPNPDEAFVEELAHFPLLFHDEPRKVLVVGGGAGGLINEVLKHPVKRVDYTELDPLIIEAIRTFAVPLTEFELDNSRVSIHNIDGRLFMSQTKESYDVIIINLPSPSSLQLNRFYTAEFFRAAAATLDKDGILAVTTPGSQSYMSEDLISITKSIYLTLGAAFPYIRIIPSDFNLLLASRSPEIALAEPNLLAQRLEERVLETRLLSDFHIQYRLNKNRVDWFLASLDRAPDVCLNRDLAPAALYYDILVWNTLASPRFADIFKLMGKANIWVFMLALAVLLAAFMVARRRITGLAKASVTVAIVTTGFASMTFNMVLILAFQSLYGYVYQAIALLTALFMVGMAIGGTATTRIMSSWQNPKSLLVKLELLALAYAVLVPVVLVVFHSYLGQPVIYTLVQVVIYMLSLASGVLVGVQFPLANKIYLQETGSIARVAGGLYAADLVGAWAGVLMVSVWLIPVLGIVNTCILVACLKAASLTTVATSRI